MLIDFRKLQARHSFTPNGVVHVGAHEGQELPVYHDMGLQHIIFIEANPDIYKRLRHNCASYPDVLCFNECVSNKDGEKLEFKIANNDGQSSSFLELGTHKQMHPEVRYIDYFTVTTIRLDTLLNGLDSHFDWLVMDIQGAEGHALKGLGDMLSQFKYLYLEVNTTEVYEGCIQLPELKEYLRDFGFYIVESFFPPNCSWGDAFFIK